MSTGSGKSLNSESMRRNAEQENRQKTVPEILQPRLRQPMILEHWEHHDRGYYRRQPQQQEPFPW